MPKDKVTKEKLIIDHIPLAKSICKRFPNLNYEERYSRSLLALTKAADKFDPEKGKFATYARTIIENELKTMYHEKNCDEILFDFCGAEASDGEGDRNYKMKCLRSIEHSYQTFEKLMTIKECLRDNKARKTKILVLMLEGNNQEECADQLNISQPTVSRMLREIREAIQNVENFLG